LDFGKITGFRLEIGVVAKFQTFQPLKFVEKQRFTCRIIMEKVWFLEKLPIFPSKIDTIAKFQTF